MDNAPVAWLLSGVIVRLAILCTWLLITRTALAAMPIPSFVDAEAADAALAFERAIEGYEETVRREPTTPAAGRAAERAAYLRARSEGRFVPLQELERIRRDPARASERVAIDGLATFAETFPPGLVRLEAWMLAADAYAQRLDRPAEAIALWRRVVIDALAPPVMRRSAAKSLTSLELARGQWDAAEADARLVGDPRLFREVRRVLRRRHVHHASMVVLVLLVVAATLGIVRGERRRVAVPVSVALGYAAYTGIVGAVLASRYEEGTARPFLLFGLALVPILLVARAWGAAGDPARPARVFRGALCAASALGAAFLVLEHVDIAYLEGLGL